MTNSLTPDQQVFCQDNGYLVDLPAIYTPTKMAKRNRNLKDLMALFRPDETAKDIKEWHEASRWLYDICMNPRILNLVKEPHTHHMVGWHQDFYYWPMAPYNSVTVWLAFTDVDEQNGAMKIVQASHKAGIIQYQRSTATDSVLTLELKSGTFRMDIAVSMRLRAGQIPMHDDRAIHGSPTSPSDRIRVGLTIRCSGTEVKNDPTVNPHFKAYPARGVDRYKHDQAGTPSTEKFGRTNFKAVSLEEAGRG